MKIRIALTITALAATTAFVTACGGGDDGTNNAERFKGEEQNVARVIDNLESAAREGDSAKICSQIFSVVQAQRLTVGNQSCAQITKRQLGSPDERIEVQGLVVSRSTAAMAAAPGLTDSFRSDGPAIRRPAAGRAARSRGGARVAGTARAGARDA